MSRLARKPKRRRSGPTIDEAERRERGQVLVGVRLSPELAERVDRECERRGLLRAALLRTALEEWLGGAR